MVAFLQENKSLNGKEFCFYISLVFCCPSVYQIFGISILIFTLIYNKQFTSWLVRLHDFYYSLLVKDR